MLKLINNPIHISGVGQLPVCSKLFALECLKLHVDRVVWLLQNERVIVKIIDQNLESFLWLGEFHMHLAQRSWAI